MPHWTIQYSYLIPLLPLIGAGIAGLFGAKVLKQQSHWPIWLGVGASAVISISLLLAMLGRAHHDGEKPPLGSAETPTTSAALHGEEGAHATAGAPNLSAVKNYFSWISIGKFNA